MDVTPNENGRYAQRFWTLRPMKMDGRANENGRLFSFVIYSESIGTATSSPITGVLSSGISAFFNPKEI